jgi:hypothetical protein
MAATERGNPTWPERAKALLQKWQAEKNAVRVAKMFGKQRLNRAGVTEFVANQRKAEFPMRRRAISGFVFFAFDCFLVLSMAADQKPPMFLFGGKPFYVGMSEHEAEESLAVCCTLSPPVDAGVEKLAAPAGKLLGHMILAKEESPLHMLGGIYFSQGKVVRITRPLDNNLDNWNEHLVTFARALNRALSPSVGDAERLVRVSVRHERLSNAESDILSFEFPEGRGIEIQIGTLDKADADTGKRDFVVLDEALEPRRN